LGCDPKPAGGQPQSVLLQTGSALYSVYSLLFTPETRGHVCQKFHHPTLNVFGLKFGVGKSYISATLQQPKPKTKNQKLRTKKL
jgi:predicted GTPase